MKPARSKTGAASIALSASLHVGIFWLALPLTRSSAEPFLQEVELTLIRGALVATDAPSPNRSAVVTPGLPAPREAPASIAKRPAAPAAPAARRVSALPPRRTAQPPPGTGTSTPTAPPDTGDGAGSPAETSRIAAAPTSGGTSSRSLRTGPRGSPDVLARYLKSARERVSRHRQYPYLARRARLEGTVCLRLWVAASGVIRRVRATCGQSQDLLLRAALQAVEDAAPLAPLPPELGRELTLEVPVVFELTL